MTQIAVENITCFDHVPKPLKKWFIAHFIIDFVIAVPIFFFPRIILEFLGWTEIDPFSTRLVAAALFGIGGISFVSRAEQVDTYRSLVKMKLIWSIAAEIGILITLIFEFSEFPVIAWVFLVIFIGFTIVWAYWLNLLNSYE